MRKTHLEPHVTTKVVVDAVTCDRCLAPMLLDQYEITGVSFRLSFGYGSRFDTDEWKFDMCDDCAGWLRDQLSAVSPAQETSE